MQSERVTVAKARELLGEHARGMTDEQIQRWLEGMEKLATVVVRVYRRRSQVGCPSKGKESKE